MKKFSIGLLILLAGIAAGYAAVRGYPFFDHTPVTETLPHDIQSGAGLLYAVVVDNDPGARPQAGLERADLVIETLAEGGVTRFLAFFQSNEAEKIGPVRSARPYFVKWALGEGAVLAHSGGSKEALEEIDSASNFQDANEFYNEKTFWRDKSLPAPRNLFTSTKLLAGLAERKNWQNSSQLPLWNRGGATPSLLQREGGGEFSTVSVNFSYAPYAVSFTYDNAAKTYARKQTGSPQVSVSSLLVLHTQSTVIDEKLLTLDLQTVGSGRAEVFREGKVLQARWRKDSPQDPLQILDADGTSVSLGKGLLWIAVLDQQGTASWR